MRQYRRAAVPDKPPAQRRSVASGETVRGTGVKGVKGVKNPDGKLLC